MMNFFSNERGFGLLQVMALASILSAGGIVMTRAILDLKMAQKNVETRDSLELLHSSVVAALQDSANCTRTHAYNTSTTPFSGAIPSLKEIRLASNEVIIQEGRVYMNGDVRVDTITTTVGNPGTISVSYSRLKEDQRLKKGYGGKDIRKTVPVTFVSASGVFDRCYLDENLYNSQSARDFCEGLGSFMRWEATGTKCVLKNHICSDTPGTVFVGVDNNGNEICQTITEAINTTDLFDVTSTTCPARTSLALDTSSGKIRITCNAGCVPASTCLTIAAGVPCNVPAGNDSCGNNCGTGTLGCGLPDGTICSDLPASSGRPYCTNCTNPPHVTCSCGTNPVTQATCGQLSNCTAWGMCY